MNTITTKDGTQIYYKDWGSGQPIIFSHGWPLSADAWEDQMVFLGAHGYRCIAHDRRGHGRSSQSWNGNEMDTFSDDLAELVEKLNLTNAIHVGHSMGGGEVARYIGRHPPVALITNEKKAGKFSGTLAEGTITEKELLGSLMGKSVKDLVKEIKKRNA